MKKTLQSRIPCALGALSCLLFLGPTAFAISVDASPFGDPFGLSVDDVCRRGCGGAPDTGSTLGLLAVGLAALICLHSYWRRCKKPADLG